MLNILAWVAYRLASPTRPTECCCENCQQPASITYLESEETSERTTEQQARAQARA